MSETHEAAGLLSLSGALGYAYGWRDNIALAIQNIEKLIEGSEATLTVAEVRDQLTEETLHEVADRMRKMKGDRVILLEMLETAQGLVDGVLAEMGATAVRAYVEEVESK